MCRRAGTKTVAVLTGNGINESKYFPDYTFKNLLEVVNLILGDNTN